VVYQKRLGGKNGYTASLVAADGRIYCTDEEGNVRVVKAGPEFQLLAINKLGEECLSHPAISNGRIYFRGREHVMAFAVAPVKQ
jgi:outer membrane protein assembly factor BamB